jgi:hypothetical protein
MIDGDTVTIHADITAQVDADEVTQAIATLRENENARAELSALRTESDTLHQQLDAANRALTEAASPEETQMLNQQRQDVLNQLQANALVSQAWTDWVYVTPIVYPYPWVGIQQARGLLFQARQLYPGSRHLQVVQQALAAQAGSSPTPPATGMVPPTPRGSLLVPLPATPRLNSPSEHHPPPAASASERPYQPLPPTLQQVHPPHLAQPNPPVPRAPYAVQRSLSQSNSPQHSGGGGHFGGGHGGR